jgi:hypothetical protein
MSSICSFGTENSEKCAPTSIHDAFGKVVVLHHIGDLKFFHSDALIAFSIGLCRFEMVIPALAVDFQVRFRHVFRGFPASVAALLPSAHHPLFSSEYPL